MPPKRTLNFTRLDANKSVFARELTILDCAFTDNQFSRE